MKFPYEYEVLGSDRMRLRMKLDRESRIAFAEIIDDVFKSGQERRLDLGLDWMIYFQVRDSETRLLVAHPEEKKWVATLSFERQLCEKLVALLRNEQVKERFSVSDLSPVWQMGNLVLDFEFL